MDNKKISIIVPVYQVEKYLEECLDSIIEQTYKNLEIIVVDDGSKDNSSKICDNYKEKDNRIIVIHKENGGISSARNAGLDIATGEYIAFFDSDDMYYSKYAIENMYNLLESNEAADMCITQYIKIDENGNVIEENKSSDYDVTKVSKDDEVIEKNSDIRVINEDEFWREFLEKDEIYKIVVWTKLYRRKIWSELRYPEGKINEDLYVLTDTVRLCNKIVLSNEIIISYRQRKGSIMDDEKTFASIDSCESRAIMVNYLGKAGKYSFAKQAFKRGTVQLICSYRYYRKHDKSKMKRIKDLYRTYKDALKKGYVKAEGMSEKIQFFLFKINLSTYRFIRNIFTSYKV